MKHKTYERLLAPGVAGVPTPVVVDGLVVRASYIAAESDVDAEVQRATPTLATDRCHLLFLFPSPDGWPFRSARIFVFAEERSISWQENSHAYHSQPSLRFSTPTLNDGYTWECDLRRGLSGWFLTGTGGATGLWKVARYEVDAFGHWLLTLRPVQSASGMPLLDLSRMTDELLRNELLAQYEELQGSVSRHAYRDIVTKARNITEGILGWVLMEAGDQPGKDLYDHLQKLQKLVEKRSAPTSDLSYHLAHKIRLLHARTHPQAASSQGSPVSPELAMSCLEDLKEILKDLGLIEFPKRIEDSVSGS